MNDQRNKNYEIALIAMSVAMIIGGGIGIYMISAVFPIPGGKYIMMAPFVSTVLYIIQIKLKGNFTILKLGAVFALTMTIINVFMGIAIIVTTLLTHFSIRWIASYEKKAFWGGVLFAGFMGLSALTITKAFIGGIVDDVPYYWFVGIGMLCSVFGVFGTMLAKRALRHLNGYLVNGDKFN